MWSNERTVQFKHGTWSGVTIKTSVEYTNQLSGFITYFVDVFRPHKVSSNLNTKVLVTSNTRHMGSIHSQTWWRD